MYFIDGINPNEIGDFEVVEHEGRLHVFYLTLPSHDTIGHLVQGPCAAHLEEWLRAAR